MTTNPEFNLINIQFSDGLQSHTYGDLICQSWNQDLWCLTFKIHNRDYQSMLWKQPANIWTHVYRRRPNVAYMFDLVFKVDLSNVYNKPGTKFDKVRICTTDSPTHYHLITTNTRNKQFMACGYLVTIGDDIPAKLEKFKKISAPQEGFAKMTTLGNHGSLY